MTAKRRSSSTFVASSLAYWQVGALRLRKKMLCCSHFRQTGICCSRKEDQKKVSSLLKDSIPKFTVASTYNLRMEMGIGMPTQVRRGAWDTVSEFVMSLSIGHYERWPQCPDLLEKAGSM